MGLRVANGPVSWGVDLPDKPGAPPWQKVFDEISEAGYRLCELGPPGFLPDDNDRVRAELDARGLGVAGSYIFEPMHDRDRHEDINHTTEQTCERIAALVGREAGRDLSARRLLECGPCRVRGEQRDRAWRRRRAGTRPSRGSPARSSD